MYYWKVCRLEGENHPHASLLAHVISYIDNLEKEVGRLRERTKEIQHESSKVLGTVQSERDWLRHEYRYGRQRLERLPTESSSLLEVMTYIALTEHQAMSTAHILRLASSLDEVAYALKIRLKDNLHLDGCAASSHPPPDATRYFCSCGLAYAKWVYEKRYRDARSIAGTNDLPIEPIAFEVEQQPPSSSDFLGELDERHPSLEA